MGHQVTVLTRQGCHLCEVAEEQVARICAEFGVSYSTKDVDAERELRAEYGELVPVIMIDGAEHGYWTVEEDRFRQALAR